MASDPKVDAYIASRAEFARPILTWIRARFHAAVPEVEETIKWSHPFFTLGGRPFANMAAFKAHASFGFWNRQANETGKEGEAMGQFGRIESLADLPDAAEVERLIREAAATLGEGKPARPRAAPKGEVEVPPELAAALAGDEAARATFDGFPPSCRREYCEWIGEAKRPETRAKRVGEAMAWMREGKRRNWKYENC
ncbi:YdeI/OmpD-associated family protein [Sphingomonas sp. KR3-1]|uniref:YdeI/OmpD-associated family protein n=1 Tax=Sphingomonas sp. KR3-1 TaxID=3156611 RepID=UPI0032B5DDE3